MSSIAYSNIDWIDALVIFAFYFSSPFIQNIYLSTIQNLSRFERAVDILQSLPRSGAIQTSYDNKLLLYGVYKQGELL